MENQTLLILITVFIGLTAGAMLIQGLAIYGMYKRFQQLSARVEALTEDTRKKTQAITESLQQTIEMTRSFMDGVQKISENVISIAELVHGRLADLDRLVGESTTAVRRQVNRYQEVLDKAAGRMDQSLDIWYNSVISPAIELGALIKGIKTGFNFFLSRRAGARKSRAHNQPDEELFI